MDNWIEHLRRQKQYRFNQKVIIPGGPELEAELDRKVNGILLVDAVVKDLNELAEKLSLDGLSRL